MVSDKFDAIKVGTGEDLVTLTRWVISQQQVNDTILA
jgi:fructose-1,6-bisphosphatase I